MQWVVMTVGTPSAWAPAAAMKASGEAMPPWKWATSTRSRWSRSLTPRKVAGVNGMSKGSSGTCMRCTRMPSMSSGPGVGVITTTSWPAACRRWARSWTCISMPPRRGT